MSAVGRNLKILKTSHPPGLLLEHRNSNSNLLAEHGSLYQLSDNDAKGVKSASTKVVDGYGCLGVIGKHIGDADNKKFVDYLALITGCRSVGKVLETEILRITDVAFVSISEGNIESGIFSEIKRLLCSGSFYFTLSSNLPGKKAINITHSFQMEENQIISKRFLWNRHLLSYFSIRGISCNPWCIEVMCGGIDIRTVYVGAQQGQAAIISRLSSDRVGTRYNVRGVDDNGNVANFVETEQILCIGESCTSFVQIRGSVPLHWEQPGLNVGSHKVKLSMPFEISFKAYEKHLKNVEKLYLTCTLVNLLGSKEGEASLSRTFQTHHESSHFAESMKFINFDYHAECRVGKSANISKLMDQLDPLLESFGFYVANGNEIQQQTGVLRINCLDCLDRTNSVQTYVGLKMVSKQLDVLGCSAPQLVSRFTEAIKSAWQQTGDLISRMYAGTAALEGKDKVGKIKDGARSLSRAIQNNLMDQGKQVAMDKLLQPNISNSDLLHVSRDLFDPEQLYCSSETLTEVYKSHHDFTEEFVIRVCVGSWNVNGGKLFRSIAYKDKTLKDWLFENDANEEKTYYQALYEYCSKEEGDLSLAVGDVVLVNEELEGGEWFHGSLSNVEGIFPAAYVEKLENPYLVVHDFPAQEDGDLQLWTNEVVNVLKEDGEWFTGCLMRDGEKTEGIFPSSFVSKMSSSNSFPVDIFAIGFEEMVELNAGNILNASLINKQLWENELQKTINGTEEYVCLVSDQLVGVCLFLFVRRSLVDHITNISVSMIKTGMGGTAGNKGAVAVSFLMYNTSMCFICSHFAAGQTQVLERNNDYNEITSNLTFTKGRKIFSHDYVFWCGDFNYRIDLSGDEVKQLVKEKNWEKLKEFDQLLVHKRMGNIFKGFMEGDMNFAPTYKYDPFSDDYDTSEKCRTPAWTDRILWKRQPWAKILCQMEDSTFDAGKLQRYGRTELKTSDHRPVVADIDVKVVSVNEERRSMKLDEIRHSIEAINVAVFVFLEGSEFDHQICTEFLYANGLEEFIGCRTLRQCIVAVYATSNKANEAVNLDGSVYQGYTIRICTADDRILLKPDRLDSPEVIETDPELTGIEQQQQESCISLTRSHYSSDNIKSLSAVHIPRPNSTPCEMNQASGGSQSSVPVVASRKPPPRPPAISSLASKTSKNSISSTVPLQPTYNPRALPFGDVTANASTAVGGEMGLTNGSAPVINMADLDFSVFEEKPPKIKPRKTLPKRPAPCPPKAPPNGSSKANRPKPPPPPIHQIDVPLLGGSLNGNLPQSSMPPPLIPFNATNTAPSANIPANNPNDPWSVSGQNKTSNVSQSFSTNFSDLLG
uniref:phosphoinositide 5-phosphatase n=1 Tax=Phallusia mammillata TaxID=59560 RepID=A0A6F9DUS2_9ASCI|nr:synaptojanin-1-like [Phallusia mammillata]